MPTTLSTGRPEYSLRAQTMASSGLVMQITKASGAYSPIPLPTDFTTSRLIDSRSSRDIPGRRGNSGGYDADVRTGDGGIAVGTAQRGVERHHRDRFAKYREPCRPARPPECRTGRCRPVLRARQDAPGFRRSVRNRSGRFSISGRPCRLAPVCKLVGTAVLQPTRNTGKTPYRKDSVAATKAAFSNRIAACRRDA